MACIVRLTLENEQLRDSPFPGRTLAVVNQRLDLSCFSASQGIPVPQED